MARPTLSDAQPPRDKWRVELVDQKTESGLVLFEYAVREPTKNPFLLNNHKAHIRTNHQRIVIGPNGGMMHISGVEVTDVDDFLATAKEAYRWRDRDKSGAWRDDQGRTLAPFVFPAAPWVGGADEELDPQWQRETFTLTEAEQVQECIDRYQDRMAEKGYIGDKRGTTLNLQVGANVDDGAGQGAGGVAVNGGRAVDLTNEYHGFRVVAAMAQGVTINSASPQYTTNDATFDSPAVTIKAEDQDTAENFNTGSTVFSSRTYTTASATWTATDLGAGFHTATSIVSVVQEIVDRAGWASGNYIGIIYVGNGSGGIVSTDYNTSTSAAPKLDIDYTAGGGGGATGKLVGGGLVQAAGLVGGKLVA